MNTKIAVILTVLVMLSLGMAVFILKDYVTIGNPTGEEEVAQDAAEDALPEGEGAETTLVAAATTAAGGTTVAGATTAASATTTAGATTTTGATTAAPTTTAATTASLNITTTNPQIGGIITTTSPGIGGLVTTTQGIGVLITTTATGKADLTILPGGASVAFPNVKVGDTVTLSGWTVKNQGTAPSGPFKNGFYLASNQALTSDRVYLQGNSNLSLAPGEQYSWGSSSLFIPANLTPGIYYIGVLVDRDNEVSESNESNNYVSYEIIVSQ
jgi:hypothetical protein